MQSILSTDVSLPSSLKRYKTEFLQASPVIQVFAASYAPGEVPLDTLNGFDISYLVRVPHGAAVFEFASHHSFK